MCPSAFRERLFSTFFQNPLFVVTRINLIGKLRPFLARTRRNSPTVLTQNQRNLAHVRFMMKAQPSSATSNWSCIISLSLSSSAGSCTIYGLECSQPIMDNFQVQLLLHICSARPADVESSHLQYHSVSYCCFFVTFVSFSLLDVWIYWYYVRWNTYTLIHIVHLMH